MALVHELIVLLLTVVLESLSDIASIEKRDDCSISFSLLVLNLAHAARQVRSSGQGRLPRVQEVLWWRLR